MVRNNHTFVICAYKESPYLSECVDSLKRQTVSSGILMVTSTPNAYIEKIAKDNDISLYVNDGERGITQDWNFALSQAKTRYVTIVHQDDVYEKEYTHTVVSAMEKEKHPLIGFCDYGELHNGVKVYETGMLMIKRAMLSPLKIRALYNSRFTRRCILSFGDPICCPSVTFCMDNLAMPVFKNHFRSCEDWEAWESISRRKGSFVYIPERLVYHRIHGESETTKIIDDGARVYENYEMFRKFWPAPVAKLLNRLYTGAERYNKI